MKELIAPLAGLLVVLAFTAISAHAKKPNKPHTVSADDSVRLEKAIMLLDGGMAEAAMTDFEALAKIYPKNNTIKLYKGIALMGMKKYKEAEKIFKPLTVSDNDISPMAYAYCSYCYAGMGDEKRRFKILETGVNWHRSGELNYLMGMYYIDQKEYSDALNYFARALRYNPMMYQNYIEAGLIALEIMDMRVWGMLWVETGLLLQPYNDDYLMAVGDTMHQCFEESIHTDTDGKTQVIYFLPDQNIGIVEYKDKNKRKRKCLDFESIYQACACKALRKLTANDRTISASIADMARLRKGIVDIYFADTGNLYGKAMLLPEYQKRIIDAGHWEAYNYFLFSKALPDEFTAWHNENAESLAAFLNWLDENPLLLGREGTVSYHDIYSDYRDIDQLETIDIQQRLIQ